MDALRAEIANKRKAIPDSDGRPNKYMRKGELQRLKEEREQREREEKAAAAEAAKQAELKVPTPIASKVSLHLFPNNIVCLREARVQAPSPALSDPVAARASMSATASPAPPSDAAFNISAEETIRRLRAKGQPIRLFGESDKDRRLRLRALELIEEKASERHGGQNDFKKALEEVESRERERKAQEGAEKGQKKEELAKAGTEVLDLELLKTDKNKLYPIIYHALKRILKEWEEAMDDRPDHVKRTTQGKLAAATQQQSAESLRPLFKNLRSRVSGRRFSKR
jgi:pre-mRNA-splicing factor 18